MEAIPHDRARCQTFITWTKWCFLAEPLSTILAKIWKRFHRPSPWSPGPCTPATPSGPAGGSGRPDVRQPSATPQNAPRSPTPWK